MSHTPGPWYWTAYGHPAGGPTSFRITGPELETLGFTYGYSALDADNAALMATAPELLEALEELAYWHTPICWCSNGETKQHRPECDAARAAVSKAKGETQ